MIPMLIELGSALGLVVVSPSFQIWSPPFMGLVFLMVIWGSTFFVQVPLHRRLAQEFEPQAWRALVASNWIRTVGWAARSILVLIMLKGSLD